MANAVVCLFSKTLCANVILAKPKPGSKPKDCPAGTLPIDQAKGPFGLDTRDVHDIKNGVKDAGGLAGPQDWTGITPNGEVIAGDSDGKAVNYGPYDQFTR